MTRFSIPLLVMSVVAWAEIASAHGFRIDIDGNNKLQLHSDDPTAGSQLIYKVQSLFNGTTPTSKATDHPGYDVDTLNGPNGFEGGESISFNILGPLWYSPGGTPPAHAAAGVSLSITPQDLTVPGSDTVSGSSGFQPGFLIGTWDGTSLGAYEHQLYYQLDFAGGLPAGAYAVALQLVGTNSLDQPLVASDPLVAVFNNGLSLTALNAISPQLFAAAVAVPEPESWALAAVASIGLLPLAIRRRARLGRGSR